MSKEAVCIKNTPITMNTKQFIESMKQWSDLKKTEEDQLYYLTHTYDEDPNRKFYIKAPYDYETFNAICAYIQIECSEIETSFSMDQLDIIEILEVFYGCNSSFSVEKKDMKKAKKVDLYINWESHCGSKVWEVDILKRDGMDVYFNKFVEEFYQSNPDWRPSEKTL